ncbi:MAG: hypothetical protein Q7W30_03375 [Coriobacteriia bacterium]|nr:hypothetical protein [Coriobacteriia bacterium]
MTPQNSDILAVAGPIAGFSAGPVVSALLGGGGIARYILGPATSEATTARNWRSATMPALAAFTVAAGLYPEGPAWRLLIGICAAVFTEALLAVNLSIDRLAPGSRGDSSRPAREGGGPHKHCPKDDLSGD